MANPQKKGNLSGFRLGWLFSGFANAVEILLKEVVDYPLSLAFTDPRYRDALYTFTFYPLYSLFIGIPLKWVAAPIANLAQDYLLAPILNAAWKGIAGINRLAWKGIAGTSKLAWKGIAGTSRLAWKGIAGTSKLAWKGIAGTSRLAWKGIVGTGKAVWNPISQKLYNLYFTITTSKKFQDFTYGPRKLFNAFIATPIKNIHKRIKDRFKWVSSKINNAKHRVLSPLYAKTAPISKGVSNATGGYVSSQSLKWPLRIMSIASLGYLSRNSSLNEYVISPAIKKAAGLASSAASTFASHAMTGLSSLNENMLSPFMEKGAGIMSSFANTTANYVLYPTMEGVVNTTASFAEHYAHPAMASAANTTANYAEHVVYPAMESGFNTTVSYSMAGLSSLNEYILTPLATFAWNTAVKNSFGIPFLFNTATTTLSGLGQFASTVIRPVLSNVASPFANAAMNHIIPGIATGLWNLSAYPVAFGTVTFLSIAAAQELHRQTYGFRNKFNYITGMVDKSSFTLKVDIPERFTFVNEHNNEDVRQPSYIEELQLQRVIDTCIRETRREIQYTTGKNEKDVLKNLPDLDFIYKELNGHLRTAVIDRYQAEQNKSLTHEVRCSRVDQASKTLAGKVATTVNNALNEEKSGAMLRMTKNTVKAPFNLAYYAAKTAYNNPKSACATAVAGASLAAKKYLGL